MALFEQFKSSHLILGIAVVGLVTLYLAMKLGHAIFRLVFGLIGVAAIVWAIWWSFLKH
jgi:hypothetical protein